MIRNIWKRKKLFNHSKQVEDELSLTISLLEAQSEASIDGVLVINNEGKIISFNERMKEMWNIPPETWDSCDEENLLQYAISQLKYPDEFLEKLQHVDTHEEAKLKGEIELKDGRFLDRCSYPLFDKEGRNCCKVWFFRDITERKRAERETRESEIKFRTLYDSSRDAIMLLDEKGFFDCNEATVKIFGCADRAEFCSYHPADLSPKFQPDGTDSMTSANQRIATAMERGSNSFEWMHCRTDGTEFPAEVLLSSMELGGKKVLQAVVRDITDRKRAEEELKKHHDQLDELVKRRTAKLTQANEQLQREITGRKRADDALQSSEEKYRQLVNNLGDGIGVVDEHETFTFVNPATEELFGCQPGKLLGRNLKDFLEPEQYDIVLKQTEERRQNKSSTYELPINNIEGKKRLLRVTATPNFDPDGHFMNTLGIFRDITKFRELESQLRQSQKMEAIGTLAGGVAHDFNNLLTAISGHLELAENAVDPGDPLCPDLAAIRKAADSAAELTRQLLAFSRKQTLEPKILNINAVITRMNRMLRRIIGEDIKLVTHCRKGLWSVKADPGQMEQVIVNLAVNARDAMPRGGRIIIKTENISLNGSQPGIPAGIDPGEYVILSVIDTGAGMTEEVKGRIFDPFFTTKAVGKGTGLGLSTIYGIVKQSGGNIWVESEINAGTSFVIIFPKEEGTPEQIPTREISNVLTKGNETILVVEDEEVVRKLAVRLLTGRGYNVISASTGEEACQLCRSLNFPLDLVVTDVIMPNMGGMELGEKLRQLWPNVKLLYMSGYTADAIHQEGIIDTEKMYLQKPFRLNVLAQKVREILDG